jgi:hypothetical protein
MPSNVCTPSATRLNVCRGSTAVSGDCALGRAPCQSLVVAFVAPLRVMEPSWVRVVRGWTMRMAKQFGVASEGGCRNQGDDAAALHQLGAMDKLAQTETSQDVGAALCDCVWRNAAHLIAVVRSSAKQSIRSTLRAFVPFDFIETRQPLAIRPVTLIVPSTDKAQGRSISVVLLSPTSLSSPLSYQINTMRSTNYNSLLSFCHHIDFPQLSFNG